MKRLRSKGTEVPYFIAPQLAKLTEQLPRSGQWIYERKLDGYRILARITDGEVTLFSRNAKNWTEKFKGILDDLQELKIRNAYLDGEVVALVENGSSPFQALQNSFKGGPQPVLAYYLFDILWFEGEDLRKLPLLERKKILRTRIFGNKRSKGVVRYLEHETERGRELFQQACSEKQEGIICKKSQSSYVSGRTGLWLKMKCSGNEEFIIGGFTALRDQSNAMGALLLGQYNNDGVLEYAGRVGTGFSQKDRTRFFRALRRIRRKASPFSRSVKVPGATWVQPVIVAQVGFSERTQDGLLRHPRFLGLREDKGAKEVKHEQPIS